MLLDGCHNPDGARHMGATQALLNGIVGDVVAELPPEGEGDLHSHSGVVGLMGTGELQAGFVTAEARPLMLKEAEN